MSLDGAYSLFDFVDVNALNEEVELKEPNDFGKADKMVEPTDNTKIEELDMQWILYQDSGIGLSVIVNKLNEVIRYINKEDKNE